VRLQAQSPLWVSQAIRKRCLSVLYTVLRIERLKEKVVKVQIRKKLGFCAKLRIHQL